MIQNYKSSLRDRFFSSRNFLYRKEQSIVMNYALNKSAQKALLNIQEDTGKKLPKNLKDDCDSYACDYLGNRKYAPWLYVYAAMQGKFIEGWLPQNYYLESIVNTLDSNSSRLGQIKPLTSRILETNKLPDLMYVNNGLFITPKSLAVIPHDEVFKVLFSESKKVIFKSNSSSLGEGIKFYDKKSFSINEFVKSNGVFQRIIEQHDFFNEIFPQPGATIRVTTAIDHLGAATIRGAQLRLSRKNKPSFVQASSSIRIPISSDGILSDIAYLPSWKRVYCHPDTKVEFKDMCIPNFQEACDEIIALHNSFPFIQCIGWDISINKQGKIEIMEWNTNNNNITLHEAVNGPCFKDLLELSLSYKS